MHFSRTGALSGRFGSLLALVIMLLSSAAPARPLTFGEALAQAREDAPSLRAKSLGVDAARLSRDAAGRLPDPKLRVEEDSFPISGPLAFKPSRDDFNWVNVGLSQDIPNAAKRHAQQRRADAEITTATAQAIAEARTVEVQTGLAWINFAYAEKRVAALDAVRHRLDRLVGTTPSAVAAGSARPAQVLTGRLDLAALDDRRDELASALLRARADLTRWTGDPDPAIAGPVPDFEVNGPQLHAALDANPALATVAARVNQSLADIRVAEAERRPDLSVGVSYQHRDPRFGDYVSAGVAIGLPLFQKHRQAPIIAARQADAQRVLAEQEAARRALSADLDAGLAEHAAHHARLDRSLRTLEPLARERVDLETASYSAGRAGLVDIVDAHSALANALLETLDREAAVALEAARITLTYRGETR
ncbi:MAG: TolC family protein [Sphingomicrobium sp.]